VRRITCHPLAGSERTSGLDGRRFDQLAQYLARWLRQDGGAELAAPVRQGPPLTLTPIPPASGTCPPENPAQMNSGAHADNAATGICDWQDDVAAVAEGRTRPPEQSSRASRRPPRPVSAREQEIADLIGQGLKDREIAAVLVLSQRTVHAHVRNLLDKLGLSSRTQIAAWATQHRKSGSADP
jgi:DNA-binding CsgD family transcriptional regulator